MQVQSCPASGAVIGVAPVCVVLGSAAGWVPGDVDGVTGCGLAVLDPAGPGVAVPVATDRPGLAPGAGTLPPQAASAATAPAISVARTAWSILMS